MPAPGKKPVLILTGAPGAGKTTAAGLLAVSSERAVHLESDAFFHVIRSGYIEPWTPEAHKQNMVVMRIVAEAAARYAEASYFTIVEGIISPGWFFEPLRDSLRCAGHPVAYAVLRPSLAACISRTRGREAGRLADAAVVERLWHEFADLGRLEQHAIDSEAKSAGEIADLLAQRLKDGLLVT